MRPWRHQLPWPRTGVSGHRPGGSVWTQPGPGRLQLWVCVSQWFDGEQLWAGLEAGPRDLWVPMWAGWGAGLSSWSTLGGGTMWVCLRCPVPRQPAPEPRQLPLSVQRESTELSAAGQEVQHTHLQLLSVTMQEAKAWMPARVLLQSTGVPVHPCLHEARLELTNQSSNVELTNHRPTHVWNCPTTDQHSMELTNHRPAQHGTYQSQTSSAWTCAGLKKKKTTADVGIMLEQLWWSLNWNSTWFCSTWGGTFSITTMWDVFTYLGVSTVYWPKGTNSWRYNSLSCCVSAYLCMLYIFFFYKRIIINH